MATRLSQDNVELRHALEAALTEPPPAILSDPGVAQRLERTREALCEFEEFGPLLDLVESVIHGVSNYERDVAHHALLHAVIAEHPDALELRESPEFIDWVHQQPPAVQHCLHATSQPADVSWALGLFKRETDEANAIQARRAAQSGRKARMMQAASPSPKTGAGPDSQRWSRDDIARMSLDEYRKHEAQIDDALARGEIS